MTQVGVSCEPIPRSHILNKKRNATIGQRGFSSLSIKR